MRGAFEELPNMNPAFFSFMHLAGGRLLPSPGGVLIMDKAEVIGAIGVSDDRPDIDEECAVTGIEAVGLSAKI